MSDKELLYRIIFRHLKIYGSVEDISLRSVIASAKNAGLNCTFEDVACALEEVQREVYEDIKEVG